jgi:hypothetical protein
LPLQEPGDYFLFEIAGYSFFVIMGTVGRLARQSEDGILSKGPLFTS